MDGTDETRSVQSLHSLFDASSASFPINVSLENSALSPPLGIPPSSPCLQMSLSTQQNPRQALPQTVSAHPTTFPQLNLFPHCNSSQESNQPRNGQKRSNTDVPLGFSAMIQSSPQLIPIGNQGLLAPLAGIKPIDSMKRELTSDLDWVNYSEGEVMDEFLTTRMSLDRENPPKCEVECFLKLSGDKRSAVGEIAAASGQHYRSFSMDSFMGDLSITEKSSPRKVPSLERENPGKFTLEFGNGEFTEAELKKIMANEKLAEVALCDPKRAKRILANRLSAARSKERKMKYISELEQMAQTLQAEAATLSTQLALLQRESAGLTSQNNELKFRLQAMEQQARLKEALNEALTAEVQRLKLMAGDRSGDEGASNRSLSQ